MAVINTNVSALVSQNALTRNTQALSTSMERLSTGLRINSAKDDAAGMAISSRMTSQIRGLNVAIRNANDGISLAQTAEGSLGEITNILQRMRELAVQSANATNSTSDREALNAEAQQLISEVTRIGNISSFNGTNLLNGTFTSKVFQVGANSGETITVDSIADARATGIGQHQLTTSGTKMGVTLAAQETAASAINGVPAEADLTLTTANGGTTSAIAYNLSDGAKEIAAAINTAANGVGITATATNSTTLKSFSAAGAVSFNLNGTAISATITATADLSPLLAAINGKSSTTGVTASYTTAGDYSDLTLTASDGRNIKVDAFLIGSGNGSSATFGTVTSFGATTTADSSVKTGTVSLVSSKGAITTANADAVVFASAGSNTSTFSTVASINISTANGAISALSVLDQAMTQINGSRGSLGAYMNRFEAAIGNLSTTVTNLQASRSRILDADYSKETTALAKAQIIQQAATAMLAQANAAPQSVLALLK